VALRLLIGAAVLGLLTACIPSLYPVYESGSLLVMDDIEGSWMGPEGVELLFLPRNKDGLYRGVYFSEMEDPVVLEVGFTEIGGTTYADFSVILPSRLGQDEFVRGLVGAWHGIYRVTINDDSTMLLQAMSLLTLDAMLESDPGMLAHARTDQLRLLADTAELRAFIAKTPALFDSEALRFERVN
jgi:hypothetical protein